MSRTKKARRANHEHRRTERLADGLPVGAGPSRYQPHAQPSQQPPVTRRHHSTLPPPADLPWQPPGPGPDDWLLSLPSPCFARIIHHCCSACGGTGTSLDLPTVSGMVSLLCASRTSYTTFHRLVYDAIDPGCVAELDRRVQAYHEGLQATRDLSRIGARHQPAGHAQLTSGEPTGMALTVVASGEGGKVVGSSAVPLTSSSVAAGSISKAGVDASGGCAAGAPPATAATTARQADAVDADVAARVGRVFSAGSAAWEQALQEAAAWLLPPQGTCTLAPASPLMCAVRPRVQALWRALRNALPGPPGSLAKCGLRAAEAISLGLRERDLYELPRFKRNGSKYLDARAVHCRVIEKLGPGSFAGSVADPAAMVRRRAWERYCLQPDPDAGPWLLSLPDACQLLIARSLCGRSPGRNEIKGLVSLLVTCRAAHTAFSQAAYEAIDPGCGAAWEALLQDREAKLQLLRGIAQGQEQPGQHGDGNTAAPTAAGAADGGSDVVRADGEAYSQWLRRTAAAHLLSSLPSSLERKCPVRPNVQALWDAHRPVKVMERRRSAPSDDGYRPGRFWEQWDDGPEYTMVETWQTPNLGMAKNRRSREGPGKHAPLLGDVHELVEAQADRQRLCGGDPDAGPWLLSLPGPCVEAVVRHCAADLDLPGVQGLVSLLLACRATHDTYAQLVYEALDPGCCADWADLLSQHRARLDWHRQLLAASQVQAEAPAPVPASGLDQEAAEEAGKPTAVAGVAAIAAQEGAAGLGAPAAHAIASGCATQGSVGQEATGSTAGMSAAPVAPAPAAGAVAAATAAAAQGATGNAEAAAEAAAAATAATAQRAAGGAEAAAAEPGAAVAVGAPLFVGDYDRVEFRGEEAERFRNAARAQLLAELKPPSHRKCAVRPQVISLWRAHHPRLGGEPHAMKASQVYALGLGSELSSLPMVKKPRKLTAEERRALHERAGVKAGAGRGQARAEYPAAGSEAEDYDEEGSDWDAGSIIDDDDEKEDSYDDPMLEPDWDEDDALGVYCSKYDVYLPREYYKSYYSGVAVHRSLLKRYGPGSLASCLPDIDALVETRAAREAGGVAWAQRLVRVEALMEELEVTVKDVDPTAGPGDTLQQRLEYDLDDKLMDKLLHGFGDDWYKHVGSSSRLRVWSNSLRDVSRFVSGSLSSSCIRTQLLRVKRRLQLEAALQAEGCELRTDSGLCHAFVQDGVGDPKAIATTMAEMKFLYDFTCYKVALDRLHRQKGGRQGDYWDYDGDMTSRLSGFKPSAAPNASGFNPMAERSAAAAAAAEARWQEELWELARAATNAPRLPSNLCGVDKHMLSAAARAEALQGWLARFATVDQALASPQLPKSIAHRLRTRVGQCVEGEAAAEGERQALETARPGAGARVFTWTRQPVPTPSNPCSDDC